jgi:nucleotide-binding universal stress UspA family protein
MIDTLIVATDGSASVERAVDVALDLAERFDATVHALSVVDEGDLASAPEGMREELQAALEERCEEAVRGVARRADGTHSVTAAVREGRPASVVGEYAREVDADVVATGTRGRHGEHRFLLGSVAERVVRTCPVPVLTVRQLNGDADGSGDH